MLIAFVGERTSGTLFRLLASPLKESELVTGYAVAFGAIGATQSAVLRAVGVLPFNITIVGDVFLAFAVIALLAIVSEGLGILLSSFARREAQAVQFLPFVVLPPQNPPGTTVCLGNMDVYSLGSGYIPRYTDILEILHDAPNIR